MKGAVGSYWGYRQAAAEAAIGVNIVSEDLPIRAAEAAVTEATATEI